MPYQVVIMTQINDNVEDDSPSTSKDVQLNKDTLDQDHKEEAGQDEDKDANVMMLMKSLLLNFQRFNSKAWFKLDVGCFFAFVLSSILDVMRWQPIQNFVS